jgi:formylglycine-generating enzyme required for sulfatase activity
VWDETYRELVSVIGVNDGSYTQTLPDSHGEFVHNISDFKIGKYEVTYKLWYEVYTWAGDKGYTFTNPGQEGHDGTPGAAPTAVRFEPATNISWYDIIVWFNAYSEKDGLTPVYKNSTGDVFRSTSLVTNPTVVVPDWSAEGYRLPSLGEWQYAASGKGTYGNDYASGAASDISNTTETEKVAWYDANSGGTTHAVGTTELANILGRWDMSGNVTELLWDNNALYATLNGLSDPQTDYRTAWTSTPVGYTFVTHGGAYNMVSSKVRISDQNANITDPAFTPPNKQDINTGFRLAQKASE